MTLASVDVTLGIDIGGTNTAFGFVDREGAILADSSIPTYGDRPPQELVKRVHEATTPLWRGLSDRCTLLGVGVGAPNANYYRGTVENPPNLKWPGVTNLAALLEDLYHVPVAVTNDANAAALGEMLYGAAKGMRDFIEIALGTGVGSGIVSGGDLVYGADGFAGEIGHTIVDLNGRQCGCGRRGCLETYTSASGVCRTVMELLAERVDDSELRTIPASQLTAKLIAEAATRGDAIAKAAYEKTGDILGFKLADSVAHTSPEAIILFGGVANAGELIFGPTRRSLEHHLLNLFKNKVKVIPSSLKEAGAAVLGASALIWKELQKKK
jgi:glucokinase